MANRLNNPNLFAGTPPPWILSQLDANATQNQAAWNDSSLGFVNGICTDTGSANAYVVSAGNLPFGVPSAYNPGMTLAFIPANNNTGASTMQVGSLGVTSILGPAGSALVGGEISANKLVTMIYRSTAPTGFYIVGHFPIMAEFPFAVGTNTVNCAGASYVGITYAFGAATTLNLTNLPFGIPVCIRAYNSAGSAIVFTLAATDPSGTAYANIQSFHNGAFSNPAAGVNFNAGEYKCYSGGTLTASGLGSMLQLTF